MKKKTLSKLRSIIKKERDFVDLKPYSHNIISLTLMQIAKEYGYEKANKCIDDFELENLGWKKENVNVKEKDRQ